MSLQIQNVMYDSKGQRANVNIVNNDISGGQLVQIGFPMPTTGNETQNQVDAMVKQQAKAILQAAIALL
jgi:hypothetical protein